MPAAPYHRDYGDEGSMSTIMDVVLGVRPRTKWWCPHCNNTAPGEDGLPLEEWEADEHLQERCPVRQITCASCMERVAVGDRHDHMAVCTGRVVPCGGCGSRVRECYVENHRKKCVAFGASGSVHLRLDAQCRVSHLMEGGAAEAAGVELGDLIVRVTHPRGTVPIASRDDFVGAIGARAEVFRGTEITLHVVRDEATIGSILTHSGKRGRGPTAAEVRSAARRLTESVLSIPVVMGPETAAAKAVRLKRLEALRDVFPGVKVDAVDDFMTHPKRCREHVRAAWATRDPEGGGALGYDAMNDVFRALAGGVGVDPPSAADTKLAFRELSRDGNGLLTFDEFFPYLRNMILEVVWAEGPLEPCPRCRRRVRSRNKARHAAECCGDGYPRGSLHLDVAATEPLEVTDAGPAAVHAGIQPGDILLSFNGCPVKTRLELAKAASFTKGVFPGHTARVEIRRRARRGDAASDRPASPSHAKIVAVDLTIMPLPEDAQIEAATRLADGVAKRAKDATVAAIPAPDVIQGLALGGRDVRRLVQDSFVKADDVGNGFLDRKDLARFFKILSERAMLPIPDERKMSALFAKVDPDPAGSVSFPELYPVLRTHFIADFEQHDKSAVLMALE